MNNLVLPVLGLFLISGVVSAYQINIEAPETLSVGKPLVVTGTTNFGIGTPIDVVLYTQTTTTTEIKRKIAYVQSDNTFRVIFDTTNLEKGTYKVEVPASGLGDSINMRLVELIDRTDKISLNSEFPQEFTGKLVIAGTMEGNQNAGIQIEVTSPEGERIFGPQYIATNNRGAFSAEIPITKGGTYEVSFTDVNGYIGTKSITVLGPPATGSVTLVATVTTRPTVVFAHAKASRDSPAYFEVKTGTNMMNVYTSSHIDWVMEYVDDRGVLHTVNNQGELSPEEISVQGTGKPIFFRIYPYRYSISGEVFLYAENALSVKASQTVPVVFGGNPVSTASPSETQTPIPSFLAVFAVLLAFLANYRYH